MADNGNGKVGNPWSIRFPWPMEERIVEEHRKMGRSKIDTVKWLIAYALDRLDAERNFSMFKYTGEGEF